MDKYNPNQKLGLERNSFLNNLQKRATTLYDKLKSCALPVFGSAAIAGCSSTKYIGVDLLDAFYTGAADTEKVEIKEIGLNRAYKELTDQLKHGDVKFAKLFKNPEDAKKYLIQSNFTSDYTNDIINKDALKEQRFEVREGDTGKTIGCLVGGGILGTALYLIITGAAKDKSKGGNQGGTGSSGGN